jgi:hypothetical protein
MARKQINGRLYRAQLRATFHQVSNLENVGPRRHRETELNWCKRNIFQHNFVTGRRLGAARRARYVASWGDKRRHVRSTMNTSLKVILTAIGVAVLASPVMAQPESHRAAAASISNAHGSSHTRTSRVGSGVSVEGSHIRIDDCVHVTFPQCGEDATLTSADRP